MYVLSEFWLDGLFFLFFYVHDIICSDRSRFVPVSLPTFTDMCQDADEKLFGASVLNHLLPPQSQGSQNYNLRRRIHNYALPTRTGHLTDKNIIQRMLYSNAY